VLGRRIAAVLDTAQPHVPDVQVEEAVRLAMRGEIDAVIGLGGGSPIGLAKAVAYALEGQRSGRADQSAPPPPVAQPLVPVLAIPTTYAGSEMTAVFGVTHTRENPPRKVTVSDPRVAPKLVIYDPRLTLDLPPELTAATGMNALAHCIEAVYSRSRHPLSTAAALSAIRGLAWALPRCYAQGRDLAARAAMLSAAHLAGWSLAGVTMGLQHGLAHVLGGSANVPHALAHSILLPHSLRFNAQAAAPQLLPAVEALGIPPDGQIPASAVLAAAQKVAELARRMDLPQRLRDVGVKESDLAGLAQLGFQNRTVQSNPRPVEDAGQIEALLREAW
jgi:alcohol dehydrogenase class IV